MSRNETPESEPVDSENQEWLRSVEVSDAVYFPQLGDEVVYLKQAHEEYLREVRKRNLYDVAQHEEPDDNLQLKDLEYVKVAQLDYRRQGRLRLCHLELQRRDESYAFGVGYCRVGGVADFLILRQVYEASVTRKWRLGHKVRRAVGKLWFYGKVSAVQAYNRLRYPDSQFKRIRVEWESKRLDEVSPWDIELVVNEVKGKSGNDRPAAFNYQPKSHEWPPAGRSSTCRQFWRDLVGVMSKPIAKPFLGLAKDSSYSARVKYPVDLQTVCERLENRFYRRVEALRFDLKILAENVEEIEQRNWPIASFTGENNVFGNCKELTGNLLEMFGERKQSPERAKSQQPNNSSVAGSSNKKVVNSSPTETGAENLRKRKKITTNEIVDDSSDDLSSTETVVENLRKRKIIYTNQPGRKAPVTIRRFKTAAKRSDRQSFEIGEEISINLPSRSKRSKNSDRWLVLCIVDDYNDEEEEAASGRRDIEVVEVENDVENEDNNVTDGNELNVEEPVAGPSGTTAQTADDNAIEHVGTRSSETDNGGDCPDEFLACCDAQLYNDVWWLRAVQPAKSPYFPQIGDEVVYLQQCHKAFFKYVRSTKLYFMDERDMPWAKFDFKAHEFAKVRNVDFTVHQGTRMCSLQLERCDKNGETINQVFRVKYHQVRDEPFDFVILRQHFDKTKHWQVGNRFRRIIGKNWYYGAIVAMHPWESKFPDSFYKCLRIELDNGAKSYVSPWDIEPLDGHQGNDRVVASVAVTPEDLRQLSYRYNYKPTKLDKWHPDGRTATCRRILNTVLTEDYSKLVTNSRYALIARAFYPIDISIIQKRLKNLFYRRIDALKFDIEYFSTYFYVQDLERELLKSIEKIATDQPIVDNDEISPIKREKA